MATTRCGRQQDSISFKFFFGALVLDSKRKLETQAGVAWVSGRIMLYILDEGAYVVLDNFKPFRPSVCSVHQRRRVKLGASGLSKQPQLLGICRVVGPVYQSAENEANTVEFTGVNPMIVSQCVH